MILKILNVIFKLCSSVFSAEVVSGGVEAPLAIRYPLQNEVYQDILSEDITFSSSCNDPNIWIFNLVKVLNRLFKINKIKCEFDYFNKNNVQPFCGCQGKLKKDNKEYCIIIIYAPPFTFTNKKYLVLEIYDGKLKYIIRMDENISCDDFKERSLKFVNDFLYSHKKAVGNE